MPIETIYIEGSGISGQIGPNRNRTQDEVAEALTMAYTRISDKNGEVIGEHKIWDIQSDTQGLSKLGRETIYLVVNFPEEPQTHRD
ncbi:MAG TPA: hypothetical protein VLF39_03005 [Candidatus Saccharimonadales bacterium]|nr:hypothetical protein [Candidatus Saccharimonadales bacterium]